jgi:hypothetical protein
MSTTSRWLTWRPNQAQIIEISHETGPTKPSKLSFVGFDGSALEEKPITRDFKHAPASQSDGCPYRLPDGLQLVRYTRKPVPVAVTVCSVVTDVPKFIRHALTELEARLQRPAQIKTGDSVFELLSKLADCGLELRLEERVPRSR